MADSKKAAKCVELLYDALGQIISLLDVTTDVIVCVSYYRNGRMVFFGLSASILILALIAYDIVFVMNFEDSYRTSQKIRMFLAMLPLSPIIPYLHYFAADPDSKFAKRFKDICCFPIYLGNRVSSSSDLSKLRQFMERKLFRHFAFPQAILQMAAIVIYREANIVAIISILISLLSVASKSFVFSIAFSLTLKQLFFNWLSAVTDFFGIFFVVSWVFYEPHDDDLKHAFTVIQAVWLYRIYCCALPFVATVATGMYAVMMWEFAPSTYRKSKPEIYCGRFLTFLVVTVMSICGIVGGGIASEILTWLWPAGTMWYLGTRRYPDKKVASEFYFSIIAWINQGQKHQIGSRYNGVTSYSKYQDKMMRLASFHAVACKKGGDNIGFDSECSMYLDAAVEDCYLNVTLQGFRTNTSRRYRSEFWQLFWDFYGDIFEETYSEMKRSYVHGTRAECCLDTSMAGLAFIVTFVTAPIYFLSRIWTLFYPAWIVLYLYFAYDVNVWNTDQIDLFQVVMLSVYVCSCCIIWILFVSNCREQFWMHHILPFKEYLTSINKEDNAEKLLKETYNHYYSIIVVPIRRAMVIEHFGPDIGPIIISYLPAKDEYENAGSVARVRTV